MEITLLLNFHHKPWERRLREWGERKKDLNYLWEISYIFYRGWFLVTNFCLRKNKRSQMITLKLLFVCFFSNWHLKEIQYLDIKLESEDWGFCSSFLSNDKENKGWKPTVTQSLRTRVGSCVSFFFFFKFPGPCLACALEADCVVKFQLLFLRIVHSWSCYSISMSQFPHLSVTNNSNVYFNGLLQEVNHIIWVKCLTQSQVHVNTICTDYSYFYCYTMKLRS